MAAVVTHVNRWMDMHDKAVLTTTQTCLKLTFVDILLRGMVPGTRIMYGVLMVVGYRVKAFVTYKLYVQHIICDTGSISWYLAFTRC